MTPLPASSPQQQPQQQKRSTSYRRHATTTTTTVAAFATAALSILSLIAPAPVTAATPALTRDQLYAQGGFLQNWVAPMPGSPLQAAGVNLNSGSSGEKFLVQNWSTTYHTIQIGGQDILFVNDPLSSGTTALSSNSTSNSTTIGTGDIVMQLNYPKGSYAPSIGPVMGGAQFYATPFGDKTPFSKMMVSYDVAFPSGFDWVLAGKLPGVYGGTPYDGCSGGVQSTGANCLTMRLMWRQSGAGEVYAYVPVDPKSAFCRNPEVLCNDQYGKSIGRGQIYFQPGTWTHLDMIMDLNEPAGNSNGTLQVYLNGNLAIQMDNIPYRNTGMVGFQGLLFSTFFGGSDPTYATPVDQSVYFKNVQLSVGAPAQLYNGTGGSGAMSGRRTDIGGSPLTIFGAASGFLLVLVSSLYF